MKIAIIEDDQSYRSLLEVLVKDYENWDVEFFPDSLEFGKSDLQTYDVIISDYNLPSMNGRELLKSIQHKTSAELYLMSALCDIFKEEDILNDNINGLICKLDSNEIIDHIKYCEAKIRITRLSETENNKLNEIVANGFSIETRGDIALIKINTLLGEASKQRILDQMDKVRINKAVVSFPDRTMLTSSYLGLLVALFNSFKKRKGKISFWNETKSHLIRENLVSCKLDQIFEIAESLEEAIKNLR